MAMRLQTPEKIRTLQRKLYLKAKAEPDFRFYLLYDKVYREGDRSNPSGSSLQMRAGSPPAALGRGFGVWVVRERARGAGG